MSESKSVQHFRSRLHPGDVAVPVAFGSFLVKPIASTMTPVMIVGAIMVLEGHDPLPFIAWSAPVAFGLAFAWCWFRLRTLIVEIVVTHNGAAALTVLESLRPTSRPRMQRVFDVRSVSRGFQVTIGHVNLEVDGDNWSETDEIARALETAKAYYE